MTAPYWEDDTVQLYLGDMREVLPALGVTADLVLADPPYSETSLAWDRWPDGWPALAATVSSSMWCFGSMRMFLDRRDEFAGWKLSQDVVVEKSNGSGAAIDRFRRVHEHALHWYRGPWRDLHHDVPLVAAPPEKIARNGGTARRTQAVHLGTYGTARAWTDKGTRLERSVLRVKSMRGQAIHPTEKSVSVLQPLIEYACPPTILLRICVECRSEQRPNMQSVRRDVSETPRADVLQPQVQGGSSARPSYRLRSMPGTVSPPEGISEDLLTDVCSQSDAPTGEAMRVVRNELPATDEQDQVLLQGVFDEGQRAGEEEAPAAHTQGLHHALHAGASDGDEAGLSPGASQSHGRDPGAASEARRGSSSPQRHQGRQPSRESRSSVQARPRPDSKATTETNSVPALSRDDRRLGSCAKCGGALTELEVPGLVLDPFAGSGSTLEAARLTGRRAIGIERHEPYAEAAARRLAQAPLEIA